jgi:hypothetical protein
MNVSRIPAYDRSSPDGMLIWFAEMAQRNLLFHPEDSASTIFRVADGARLFTDDESELVDGVLAEMFAEHGDKVIDACYPIFMKKAGFLHALDS